MKILGFEEFYLAVYDSHFDLFCIVKIFEIAVQYYFE